MTCLEKEQTEDERPNEKASSSSFTKTTLNELSFSHIFDYNAIEQIANGLEKMVQSWSSAQEERAQEYARVSVSLEDDETTRPKAESMTSTKESPEPPAQAAPAKPFKKLSPSLFEKKAFNPSTGGSFEKSLRQTTKDSAQHEPPRNGARLDRQEVGGFSWDIHKPAEKISNFFAEKRMSSSQKKDSELVINQELHNGVLEKSTSWEARKPGEKLNKLNNLFARKPSLSPRRSLVKTRQQQPCSSGTEDAPEKSSPRKNVRDTCSPCEERSNFFTRKCSPTRSPTNYPKPCPSPERKSLFSGLSSSPKRSPEKSSQQRPRSACEENNNSNTSRVSPTRSLKLSPCQDPEDSHRFIRESMEMRNSSTLISARGNTGVHNHDIEELESTVFSVEDFAEFRPEEEALKSESVEPRQARDTFLTSSSYWCLEPEPLRKEEQQGEKQRQECSFITDASYEKADFNTSFEERPLKRKKEAIYAMRNSGYEYEYEAAAAVEDVDSMSETVIFDECLEQAPERRLTAFARNISSKVDIDTDDSKEGYKSKVEELQIALLECAAEYEVKMVEMEMKMLQMKSKNQHLEQEAPQMIKNEKEWTTKRLENYRKQNVKLQREKELLSRDISELRKKERQLDLLRKNLEDSLQKVNGLQRELVKKEEELVDSQLKEKETKAQLYQVEAALQQAEASQIDQGSVLNLLSSLSQWLQNIKKASFVKYDPRNQLQVQQYEETLSKLMDEYVPQKTLQKFTPPVGFVSYLEDSSSPAESEINFFENNNIINNSNNIKREKEVQALQNELEKLACRRSTF